MKERGVLFSAPMVCALLAGVKTQTRRAIKPQPETTHDSKPYWYVGGFRTSWLGRAVGAEPHWGNKPLHCPYGVPGDRLRVREAWRTAESLDAFSPTEIAEKSLDAGYSTPWAPLAYAADGSRNGAWAGFGPGHGASPAQPGRLRAGMHLPRWASRITLEVTEIRVERLLDISASDCWAEGIPHSPDVNPRHEYEDLWCSINGAGSWDANPWVWVVVFRRLER